MNERTPLTGGGGSSAWTMTPQRLRALTLLALVVAMALYISSVALAGSRGVVAAASAGSTSSTATELKQAVTREQPTIEAEDKGGSRVRGAADRARKKDDVDFVPGFGAPLEKQVGWLASFEYMMSM